MARTTFGRFATTFTLIAFIAMQLPTLAFAQEDTANAEALFKQGQQYLQDKKYAEACSSFKASFKLDPSANTQLLLGICNRELGRTKTAYDYFLKTAAAQKDPGAQKFANDEAQKLLPKLLKVKVEANPVPKGVAIHFDDEEKTRDKDFVGVEIALDPGEHDLFVTAPGKHDFTKHFKLDTTSSPHTLVVNMTDKTKEELDAENRTTGGGNTTIIEKPDTQWSTVKTLGLVGMFIGGAGLIAGGVSFILTLVFQNNAITLQKQANASTTNPGNCPSLSSTTSTDTNCVNAVSAHQQALGAQSAAIGLAVVGGVIGIAGIVMFVVGGNVKTEAKPETKASIRVTPWLSPNLAGAGISGSF